MMADVVTRDRAPVMSLVMEPPHEMQRGAGSSTLQVTVLYKERTAPRSLLPKRSTDLLRRPLGPVVPVLHARDIGHPPLVSIPAVEPVHVKRPESGAEIARHDHPVGVAHVDAPDAAEDAVAHLRRKRRQVLPVE